MRTQGVAQVGRVYLLPLLAALLLFAALPVHAQEEAYTCVEFSENFVWYVKFPESKFVAGQQPFYSDSNCQVWVRMTTMGLNRARQMPAIETKPGRLAKPTSPIKSTRLASGTTYGDAMPAMSCIKPPTLVSQPQDTSMWHWSGGPCQRRLNRGE